VKTLKNPEIRFIDDNIDWKSTKLGNIGTLKNGYSFKSNLYVKDSIFNVLTISNVQGNRYIIINEDTNKYPYIPNDISTHQVLKENDILVSLTGNVGRVSLNHGKNNLLNQRVGLFDIQDKSIDKLYIFELMHSKKFENAMILQGQGAAQLNISKGDIESYEIKIPKISVQKEISHLLFDIDKKISSQEMLTQKLKDTKSALLIKMFPQENQSVPELRFKGFTDTWEQCKVSNITTSYSGGTPQVGNSEYYNGEIPFIRSGEIYDLQTELFITQKGLDNSSAKMVSQGDILYALYGATSGEVNRINFAGAINQAILVIIPNENNNPDFLVEYFRKEKNNIVSKYLQGGQGNLSAQIIKDLKIFVPSFEEQKQIGILFNKLDNLITLHQRKPFHLNFSL
jgi:type I restriction enzyme S subunit